MARIREIKTNFTSGQINNSLLGRGDLVSYQNGALTLNNVFILPTGGLTRRSGLSYIDTAEGEGRLIAFEFNTQQTYLLAVTDGQIDIYGGGTKDSSIAAPWTSEHIKQLAWTQSADTLLLTHPDVPPKTLTRNTGGTWSLQDWSYFEENGVRFQPYFKFAGSDVTLTPSGTSGNITLTASADVFTADHENTRMRVAGQEVEITDFNSPTVVSVTTIENLPNTDATIDWFEQAFSPARGYPATVAFHQDRLVIGGSRDLPNRLWLSKSGDLFNFDLGEGLDDEAIEFSILSDQVNAIRGLFSSRHLQVFTSGAEWMVTGTPLTPTSVQINRQTRTGSRTDRYIPPINVDGATHYIGGSQGNVQEFLYTDVEQAYATVDLSLLSSDIANGIIDQDYDQNRRLLFVIREDGSFSALTIYRSQTVTAWASQHTDGAALSVAAVGDTVYMLIKRGDDVFIEALDETVFLNSALTGEVGIATTDWSGLDHLEGQSVQVVADDIALEAPLTVTNGVITLPEAAKTIQVGLPYTHIVTPLPPSENGRAGSGRRIRMVKGIFRIYQTQAMVLDIGRGLKDIALSPLDTPLLDTPPPAYTKDVEVRSIGWQHDGVNALWSIKQNIPYPFTLLSVIAEIKVND